MRHTRAIGMDEATAHFEHLAQVFKALGHATRLAILHRIVTADPCVCDLQQRLQRSQANISQHLAILRDRGLVVPERRGNRVCYRLADDRIAHIVKTAEEVFDTAHQ